MTPKDKPPRLEGVQYATGEEWRKKEEAGWKQKWCPIEDVSSNESKVWYCKEQYSIGTWNVRSMNKGKFEVLKQGIARVNVDILGISESKWMGMDDLIQMTIIFTIVGKSSLEETE